MKKKILVLVMFVFCLVGLVACEEAVAPQGEKGDKGAAGLSAYEVAVKAGFEGTVSEWLESLKGQKGQTGKDGAAGQNGENGDNGLEIEVFTYDGGVYWHHVNAKSEVVGEDHLLWYYLDYITLTYSKKQFSEVDTLISTFLADVSAASGKTVTTAEEFEDEFSDDGAFMGNDSGSACGLMADNPALFAKYSFMIKWIYEWIYDQPTTNQYYGSSSSHKYEANTLAAFGISIDGLETKSDGNHLNHGNKNIVANIANFINLTADFSGTSSYYPSADFTGCDRSGVVKGGVALFDPVQIKRADVASYQLKTIAKNDPIIGDGYSFVGWVDADGKEVSSCPSNSAEIFVVTNYDGIFVDLNVDNKDETYGFAAQKLEHQSKDDGIADPSHDGYVFQGWVEVGTGKAVKAGAMMDGHEYQATWRKNNVIKLDGAFEINELAALFYADATVALAAVDPENAVTVTAENFMEVMGTNGYLFNCWFDTTEEEHYEDSEQGVLIKGTGASILDNAEFANKWGWFIQYVASKCENKYSGTAFRLWGFTPATESVAEYYPMESARLAAGCVANALQGSSSERGNSNNPPVKFNSLSAYSGFLDAFVASGIELPAGYGADLVYTGSENYIFFKPEFEFVGYQNGEDIVKSLDDIAQGLEYTIYWAAPVTLDLNGGYIYSFDNLVSLFLKDVSAAAGKEVTAENFYDTFNVKDSAGYFAGTDAPVGGVYSPLGLCASHPELVTKWGWLLNWISAKQFDSYGSTVASAFGWSYPKDGSLNTNPRYYANRYFIQNIANFLNNSDGNPSGSDSHPAYKFGLEAEYEGLEELAVANLVSEFGITKAFAKDVASIVKQIVYPDHQFLGFYLSTDQSKTYVEYKDMVIKGATYVADYAVPVTLDFGGGIVPQYTSVKPLIEAFLADLSVAAEKEITVDNFWSEFGDLPENTSDFSVEGTFIFILKKLDGKWNNLLNFILATGKTENKRIKGAADELGLTYTYTGSSITKDNFSEQFLANWVYNFVSQTGEPLHNGNKTSYPAPAFSAATDYSSLLVKFGKSSVKALPDEIATFAESVVYSEHKFLGFALSGSQDILRYEDMTDPAATYVAVYESIVTINDLNGYVLFNIKELIIDEFLKDVSAAAGKEVTAENFYDTFDVKDSAGYFAGTDAPVGEVYSPLGLCASHPELVTKWGWLLDWISSKQFDSYGSAVASAFGWSYPKDGSLTTNPRYYANRYFIQNVANFLNDSDGNPSGSSSHPAFKFGSNKALSGLFEAYIKNNPNFVTDFGKTAKVFASDVKGYYHEGDLPIVLKVVEGEICTAFICDSKGLVSKLEAGKEYHVAEVSTYEFFTDWSNQADYQKPEWTVEKYTDKWTTLTSVEMRCSEVGADKVHTVNFACEQNTRRYTFDLGKSLGLANNFSFKASNHHDNPQSIALKIKIVDTQGNEQYVLGAASGANEWSTFPPTGSCVSINLDFEACEVAKIVIVIKSPKSSAYLYIGEATLSYKESK